MSTLVVQPAVPAVRRLDSRFVITGALIATICAIFWLGSRYPSLQSKAGADPDESLSTPLGFESHWTEPRPGGRPAAVDEGRSTRLAEAAAGAREAARPADLPVDRVALAPGNYTLTRYALKAERHEGR